MIPRHLHDESKGPEWAEFDRAGRRRPWHVPQLFIKRPAEIPLDGGQGGDVEA